MSEDAEEFPAGTVLAALLHEMRERFDSLDRRLDAIDKRLAAFVSALEQVLNESPQGARLDTMSSKLDDLRVEVSACHENDLSLVELFNAHGSTWNDRFAEVSAQLHDIREMVHSLHLRLHPFPR